MEDPISKQTAFLKKGFGYVLKSKRQVHSTTQIFAVTQWWVLCNLICSLLDWMAGRTECVREDVAYRDHEACGRRMNLVKPLPKTSTECVGDRGHTWWWALEGPMTIAAHLFDGCLWERFPKSNRNHMEKTSFPFILKPLKPPPLFAPPFLSFPLPFLFLFPVSVFIWQRAQDLGQHCLLSASYALNPSGISNELLKDNMAAQNKGKDIY